MGPSVLLRVMSSAVLILATLRVVRCQCTDYESERTTVCSMLFQRFQSALVGSSVNLYNLRKTFSPASHSAPILVNASYEISIGHVPDNLCPGVDNDSTLFNASETQYLNYGWTSSVLYTFIHPAVLNRLQPQLVFLFVRYVAKDDSEYHSHVSTAFTWDGTDPITTAQLSLYIPSLPCSPSYEDVYNTLWDITSVLKAYAEVQANLTTWKTDSAGYVINGTHLSLRSEDWMSDPASTIYTFLYLSTFASFLLAAIFSTLITYKVSHFEGDDFEMWHSLFWVSIGVLAQFNIVLLLTDLVQISTWCVSPTGCSVTGVYKLFWFMYVLGYSGLCFYLFCKCFHGEEQGESITRFLQVEWRKFFVFFPFNILTPLIVLCLLCNRVPKCFMKFTTSFFHAIFMPTLLTTLSLVLFYLLPVLLLLVVHPIKVAAVYTFLTAALVLYILIAFYGEYMIVSLKDGINRWFLFFYLFVPQLNMTFILVILIFYVAVYAVILSGGYDNTLSNLILSQIPSLILSLAIWFFKKRFLKKKKREECEHHSEVDNSLQPSEGNATSESSRMDIPLVPQASGGQIQSPQQPNYGAADETKKP